MANLRDKTQYITDMRRKSVNWPKGAKYVTGSWAGDGFLKQRLKEFTKAEQAALEAEQNDLGDALRTLKTREELNGIHKR